MSEESRKQAKKRKVKKNRPGFRGEPSEAGRRILAALSRLGMNAHDLALRIGVSDMTVSRWIADASGMTFVNRQAVRAVLGEDAC